MYRPPAASHTLGRSSWYGGLIALLAGLALLSSALLAFSNTEPVFRLGTVLVTACCTALALFGWARSATGTLQWDGEHWQWSGFADVSVHKTLLVLDFQGLLLLRLTSEEGDAAWLWLQGRMQDAHWLALRRAVVASQASTAENGALLQEPDKAIP